MTDFDLEQYKSVTKQEWENVADGWHKWFDFFSEFLSEGTSRMLDMAGISKGHYVLDIAAGDGEQSLQAAKRVGSSGRVLATDISQNLLDYASKAARKLGYDHMETRLMDAGQLELQDNSFDAVICRNGLMLLPDLKSTLSEIYRVLKPQGRFAGMVFSTPEKNPYMSIPAMTAMKRANMKPKPGMPGLFSLSQPGIIEQKLNEAKFQDVTIVNIEQKFRMKTASECLQFIREIAGAIHSILSPLSDQEKENVWLEIRHGLEKFEGKEGFEAPSEFILFSGMKI